MFSFSGGCVRFFLFCDAKIISTIGEEFAGSDKLCDIVGLVQELKEPLPRKPPKKEA